MHRDRCGVHLVTKNSGEQHSRQQWDKEAEQSRRVDLCCPSDLPHLLRPQQHHAVDSLRPPESRNSKQRLQLLHHNAVSGESQQRPGPFHLLLRVGRVQGAREEHAAVPEQQKRGAGEGHVQLHEVLQEEQVVRVREHQHGDQRLLETENTD